MIKLVHSNYIQLENHVLRYKQHIDLRNTLTKKREKNYSIATLKRDIQ